MIDLLIAAFLRRRPCRYLKPKINHMVACDLLNRRPVYSRPGNRNERPNALRFFLANLRRRRRYQSAKFRI